MQDVGSEKTLTEATTAGEMGSTALQLRNNHDKTELEARRETTVADCLPRLGVSRKIARKILLLSGLDKKTLDRSVVAGVVTGDWLNSMERLCRMQAHLTSLVCTAPKLAADGKTVIYDKEFKVAAAAVVAGLTTAIARIGEQLIKVGDGQIIGTSSDPKSQATINMQFNMPPIAKPIVDANTGTDV